jgi:putative two-component system response regulator
MKRRKLFFDEKRERDLTLISVTAFILCTAILADSIIYFLAQMNLYDNSAESAASTTQRMLFIVSLLSFLVLVFAFMRILRRMRSELRVHEVQYKILQSMSRVIAYEYEKDGDLLTSTYYQPDGTMERRVCKNYLRAKVFCNSVREDSCDDFEETFRRLLSAPMLDTSEFPMKIIGEECRWYRFSSQSMTDERGNVVGLVGSAVDVDDLVTARDEALEEAATDAMTGLLGKTAFAARASERMRHPKAAPATLLMIDIDNFKEINDTCGHLHGDRMLSGIAQLLQRVFSADDLIGRFGGDEFVVFMQGIARENTEKKLMHFRRRLSEIQDELGNSVTCSIGAFCESGKDISFDELLQKADEAMYRAKNSGKNNFYMIDETFK